MSLALPWEVGVKGTASVQVWDGAASTGRGTMLPGSPVLEEALKGEKGFVEREGGLRDSIFLPSFDNYLLIADHVLGIVNVRGGAVTALQAPR